MFAGIDWASQEHAVCVHDGAGRNLASFIITHSAVGFEDLVGRLARYGEPAELPVAIERPDGRLVDRLLEAGHPVVPVSSKRSRRGARRRSPPGPSPTPATPRPSASTCVCASIGCDHSSPTANTPVPCVPRCGPEPTW